MRRMSTIPLFRAECPQKTDVNLRIENIYQFCDMTKDYSVGTFTNQAKIDGVSVKDPKNFSYNLASAAESQPDSFSRNGHGGTTYPLEQTRS